MIEDFKYDIIIGIDIGLHGAISFLDAITGEILSIRDMPFNYEITKSGRKRGYINISDLVSILEIPKVHNEIAIAVMEDIHSFGMEGGLALGSIMEQKGFCRGICASLGYDELLIAPKDWQNFFSIKCPKDIKGKAKRRKYIKTESIKKAIFLQNEWKDKFEGKEADGRADSVLIAEYASLNMR
jgi:hypothetical protein